MLVIPGAEYIQYRVIRHSSHIRWFVLVMENLQQKGSGETVPSAAEEGA